MAVKVIRVTAGEGLMRILRRGEGSEYEKRKEVRIDEVQDGYHIDQLGSPAISTECNCLTQGSKSESDDGLLTWRGMRRLARRWMR